MVVAAQQPVFPLRAVAFNRTVHHDTHTLPGFAWHIEQFAATVYRDRAPTGVRNVFAPPVPLNSAPTNLNVFFRVDEGNSFWPRFAGHNPRLNAPTMMRVNRCSVRPLPRRFPTFGMQPALWVTR